MYAADFPISFTHFLISNLLPVFAYTIIEIRAQINSIYIFFTLLIKLYSYILIISLKYLIDLLQERVPVFLE